MKAQSDPGSEQLINNPACTLTLSWGQCFDGALSVASVPSQSRCNYFALPQVYLEFLRSTSLTRNVSSFRSSLLCITAAFTLSARIMTLQFSLTPKLHPNEPVGHAVYDPCSVRTAAVSSFTLSLLITLLHFSVKLVFVQVLGYHSSSYRE